MARPRGKLEASLVFVYLPVKLLLLADSKLSRVAGTVVEAGHDRSVLVTQTAIVICVTEIKIALGGN